MPGKMTRPDDGRKNNPGGYRGGGRPRLTDPSESRARKIHQVRAHDDEWPIIKAFIDCTRLDKELCKLAIIRLRQDIKINQKKVEEERRTTKQLATNESISIAQDLKEQGYTQLDIALKMGVSQAYVSKLLQPIKKKTVVTEATKQRIQEIKELLSIGLTQEEIAQRLGISRPRVSQLSRMS